eukprot:scaffold24382_cov30-Cyclotella_meneghiniana.AAC.1
MAGSLLIAVQTLPNPTNTITNAKATGGGVGRGDSAAVAVTIAAEAAHKWTDDGRSPLDHLRMEGKWP